MNISTFKQIMAESVVQKAMAGFTYEELTDMLADGTTLNRKAI